MKLDMITRLSTNENNERPLRLELRTLDKETHSFFSDHPEYWEQIQVELFDALSEVVEAYRNENPYSV